MDPHHMYYKCMEANTRVPIVDLPTFDLSLPLHHYDNKF